MIWLEFEFEFEFAWWKLVQHIYCTIDLSFFRLHLWYCACSILWGSKGLCMRFLRLKYFKRLRKMMRNSCID